MTEKIDRGKCNKMLYFGKKLNNSALHARHPY